MYKRQEVAGAATRPPSNQTFDIAGPEALPIADFVRHLFAVKGDSREITVDPEARYFGARLAARALVPAGEARLGKVNFEAWVASCN